MFSIISYLAVLLIVLALRLSYQLGYQDGATNTPPSPPSLRLLPYFDN